MTAMTPSEYNEHQLDTNALTFDHITELVRFWQHGHGLEPDGKAGPLTIASLAAAANRPPALPMKLACPLPRLGDGRVGVITQGFRPADNPKHSGVDYFYEWRRGDWPDFVGDHGAAGHNADGTPRWGVPFGTLVIAAAAGRVQMADDSPTGYRVWIDHGNGMRTGYFHLLDLRVTHGQSVKTGDPLGLVGDNPNDNDGRHLHFELSPVDRYDPIDPAPSVTL